MVTKPDTQVRQQMIKKWAIAFAVAVCIFGVSVYFSRQGNVFGWELSLFTAINVWPEGLYRFMFIMTFFGSTTMALLIVLLAFAFRMYRLALRLSLTILGAYGIVAFAKHFVGRDRPIGLVEDAHVRIAETGMGFPSGHATLITIIMLSILPYIPKRWRWVLPVPIVLVCLSRLYLGVHLPLDIVGGLALGTAAVAFTWILPRPLKEWLRIS